jgi:hypothetical protein
MKYFLAILGICLIVYFNVNTDTTIKKIEKNYEPLEYLLSPSNFQSKKQFGRYKVSEIFSLSDSLILRLKREGLIKDNSIIYYTSAQCISLVTRVNEKFAGGFVDYVISNNLNESDFACGLNSMYNLIQDEEIMKLKIVVTKTNSFLTLAEVEGY